MTRPTAKQLVGEHVDALRNMTHAELFAFAREHGFDSRAGFTAFKKALAAAGIDYDALRNAKRAADTAQLEASAAVALTLYSDAKASLGRFGICDKNGRPVWYGRFFESDADYNGEQSSGEMAAAKKAVWLAAKAKSAVGADAIRLTLFVDAEWLTWANGAARGEPGKLGGKARALGELARRYGVLLEVRHVPGTENPADYYTICDGYQRWQDVNLASLVEDAEASA